MAVDEARVVVIGLGYVGLPLAVALADHFDVTAFDIAEPRIIELMAGHDRTGEVSAERLCRSSVRFTSSIAACRGASTFIVTVPTPVDEINRPDLTALLSATQIVGQMIEPASESLVIFESTVYPGVTEDVCGGALEAAGLSRGRDFKLGYSPERINPGDREHTIDRIVKVVSGEDTHTLARVAAVYDPITTGGVFRAKSIRVAEAAKVIENAQRDINIAFINEITQIFSELDLSVWDVLAAARTKWNFLDFQPGLVGGHCIGVDPYYLAHAAIENGRDPRVILAGRATNDGMGAWIAEKLHECRARKAGTALVMGLTFKENVPDIRNSKAVDVVKRLAQLGHEVTLHDPLADGGEFFREHHLTTSPTALSRSYDLVVCAVPHRDYREMEASRIRTLCNPDGLVADLRNIWADHDLPNRWSL